MKTKLFILITLLIITLSSCTPGDIDKDDVKEATNTVLNSSFIKPYLELVYPAPKLTLKIDNASIQYGETGSLSYDSNIVQEINVAPLDEVTEIDSEANVVTMELDSAPDKITEKIYKDNELIDSVEITNDNLIMPTHEGLYRIQLDCLWTSEDKKGKVVYSFNCYYNMPSEFTISSNRLEPGNIIIIHAENVKDSSTISVDTELFNNEIVFYPEENGFFGVIPIDGALNPMDYPITIKSDEDDIKFEDTVTVLERKYPIQYLQVTSTTLSLRNQESIEKNSETLAESRDINVSSDTILWSEPFIVPANGIITTEFYQIRYTNDNPISRRHTGVDIAAGYNTPIYATNSGIVVVAEEMTLTGNTIVIDHGCGLFSTYGHLNAMNYLPGQVVNRGDVIGLMGSTGFSTGAHLHFEMYYNGVYVDPGFFYDNDPYLDSLSDK